MMRFKPKKMKKGRYRKAKIKFLNKNVYSYKLTKRGTFGSDYIEVKNEPNILRTVWFGGRKADWQYDMENISGFAERFIWAQNLSRTQPKEFYFTYVLNKDHKY